MKPDRPILRRSHIGATFIAFHVLACLLWVAPVSCETLSYDTPAWKREIEKGYFPYHRLTAADFPIDDKPHLKYAMYTMGFFHYTYKYEWATEDGHTTARITQWVVRSGFNRNKSWRKSWYKFVEKLLPHEQGHLDINELHSRRLARMDLDELPTGKGATSREATADLKRKIEELADECSADNQAEQDEYDDETSHGTNQARQREATAALQKRLKKAGITYADE